MNYKQYFFNALEVSFINKSDLNSQVSVSKQNNLFEFQLNVHYNFESNWKVNHEQYRLSLLIYANQTLLI